jgi:hypothetical protein
MTGSYKVTVCLEKDGDRIRAWSDDVPGLVLSSTDVRGLLADVVTALELILSEKFKVDIKVQELVSIEDAMRNSHDADTIPHAAFLSAAREYVAFC